jgi:hypothetical protein
MRAARVGRAPGNDEAESTVTRRWCERGPGEMNDVDSGSWAYGQGSMTQNRARRHEE